MKILVAAGTILLILSATLYISAVDVSSPLSLEIPIPALAAGPIQSIKSGVWSDPTIWNPQKVPSFSDDVIISSGTTVTYDVYSMNSIGNMTIDGKLIFSSNKSTQLDVGNIMVTPIGSLAIGSEDNPLPRRHSTTIRFVMDESGKNGLMVMGQAEIHGDPVNHTFTKLASDVKKESTDLFVTDDVNDWKAGSTIVITKSGRNSCTEVNHVLASGGRTITLTDPLRCNHSGTELIRADVALLTRNIVITSKDSNLRGHTMFMENSTGSISYAEFVNLGAENKLGRYPIHFHKMGDSAEGMFVQGASIWNSKNRWITIHSSIGVKLRDNVGFDSVGHGYFLEGGDELYNNIDHNIGILTRKGSLIHSDASAAVFWLENPLNNITNNIAVEGLYYGFKYDVPNRVEELKAIGEANLRSLPILEFENNEAHNNKVYGLWTSVGAKYNSKDQIIPLSNIDNFLSWRNGYWGILLNGRGTEVTNSIFIGNIRGGNIGFQGDSNVVQNSHAIGEVDDDRKPSRSGVVFASGHNNILKDSILEGHTESLPRSSADVRVGDVDAEITGTIINTKMLSPRTIIFGYPQFSTTHLTVQNYLAPNDNHATVPTNFTLWRIDNEIAGGVVDTYFVALTTTK